MNAYLEIKYFLKTDATFMKKKLDKAFIKKSYMNDKTCGGPENTRKRQISHILETSTTHATE